jgi:hypothetical protein
VLIDVIRPSKVRDDPIRGDDTGMPDNGKQPAAEKMD